MKVSVICNTCNRVNHLRRLLVTLSKQTYDDFEVIVVNGPSEDNTDEFLQEYAEVIKVMKCPVKRLGVSRNIGLNNAAGDICVFIDDDAVPGDKYWLERLVDCYGNSEVGGVGGPVYNLQGGIQFRNGYVDVWGVPHAVQNETVDYNNPKGQYFSCLMGCNCSFRSKVLKKIGGFDEFYDYFHDESDVSVRIIKAGYKIIQAPNVYVFHEKALGHIRKDNYHWDWYTIMRSQVYFGVINSGEFMENINDRIKQVRKIAEKRLDYFNESYERGYIDDEDLKQFNHMWEKGVKDGLEAALNGKRMLLQVKENRREFKRYDKHIFKDVLNIVMLCENFSIDDSRDGIASYTERLAKDYAAQGHCVHVITFGDKPQFNLLKNVNVHTVLSEAKELPLLKGRRILNTVLTNSYEAMRKIAQLDAVFHIDVVETPLWNSIGLLTKYVLPDVPLCIRLETPLKMVVETQKWRESAELKSLEALELDLLKRADGVLYISDSIKNTVETLYDVDLTNKSKRNYLGIVPGTRINTEGGKLKIFFIGRLERRKGIHSLLSVIPGIVERYPDVEFRIAGDDSVIDSVLKETFKENFQRKTGNKYKDNVIFLGKISKEEKEKELQKCDMFVAPSLYESFGIVFTEAMRYGKPVIGCAVGGMKEIIQDGTTGLLINPDSTEELKDAIIRLINEPNLRIMFGENAIARIIEIFNNEKQAGEAIEFYKHIIANKIRSGNQLENNIIREMILYRQRYIKEQPFSELEEKSELISELLIDEGKNVCHHFPWKKVNAGESIVIYGGGKVGREYIRQLSVIPFCKLIAICDKNPEGIAGMNLPIISIKALEKMDEKLYDKIVVAVYKRHDADAIMKELEAIGISNEKIVWDEKGI